MSTRELFLGEELGRIIVIMSTLFLFWELEGGMGTFFDPPLSYVSPAHNLIFFFYMDFPNRDSISSSILETVSTS